MDVNKLIELKKNLNDLKSKMKSLDYKKSKGALSDAEEVELDVINMHYNLLYSEYEFALRSYVSNVNRFCSEVGI